jgi:hypothetical protein
LVWEEKPNLVKAQSAQPTILSLTLLDADTDQPIAAFDPLVDGAQINLAELPTRNLSILANVDPVTVKSVRFDLSGNLTRTESILPYALLGDDPVGNYNPWTPTPGSYTLTTTPYSKQSGGGTAGPALTVTFEVIDEALPTVTPTPTGTSVNLSVTGFTLLDADTDQPIAAFDPLVDGAQINLAELPTGNLNIRANTDPQIVGSLYFELNGQPSGVDNTEAYTLTGDAWTPVANSYTLTAIPYSQPDGQGVAGSALTITFEVVDNASPTATPTPAAGTPDPTPTDTPTVTPTATSVVASTNQWAIYELEFTAGQQYSWQEFPLQVTFEHSSGTQLTLDGYWAGGQTWRVRFTPTRPGVWEWRTTSPDAALNNQTGSLEAVAPTFDLISANPNYRGHLSVSPNGRHLVYADGTPFFWLGDTNWRFNALECGLAEGSNGRPLYEYLQDRQDKNFTVIQTQFYKLDEPNEGGDPFLGNQGGNENFDDLNPQYFQAVDTRMQELWNKGLVLAAHPTWFNKLFNTPTEDQKLISRYLLARYGAYNLIWSLSGEYQYSYDLAGWDTADWNDLGNFVQTYNPYQHPVTVHPSSLTRWSKKAPGAGQQSSSGEFHKQAWLALNWLQTGHISAKLSNIPLRLAQDYAKTPAKPIIHSEGWYEHKLKDGELATSAQIRWQAWVTYLNGGAGHTYGVHGIVLFYDPEVNTEPPPDLYEETPWYEGVDAPGGSALPHLYNFFNGMAWWNLEPHRNWLRVNDKAPRYDYQKNRQDPHLAASPDRHDLIIYIPEKNHDKKISLTNLGAQQAYNARWFNPRDGSWVTTNLSNPISADSNGKWTLPNRPTPAAEDWVLYLSQN